MMYKRPRLKKNNHDKLKPITGLMINLRIPALLKKIASKKTGQRPDFLGALKESNSNQAAAASQETAKSDQNKTEEAASPPPPLTVTFDDGQDNYFYKYFG